MINKIGNIFFSTLQNLVGHRTPNTIVNFPKEAFTISTFFFNPFSARNTQLLLT